MRHFAFTAALACAVPAFAQPTLYLADYKFNDPLLSRLNPDGSVVTPLPGVIPAADWLVVGLFVDGDAEKIYWVHGGFNEGRISRANLDGSGREVLLSGLTNPRGLAVDVDAGLMFWSDTQDRVLYRAALDGSGLTPIRDTGDQYGRPTVDALSQLVYYGNLATGQIRRCAYDGSGDELVVSGGDDPVGIALDLDAGRLYWTDAQTVTNYIARANLDGSGFEVLVDFPLESSGLSDIRVAPDIGAVYWIDEITTDQKGLWVAGLDGQSPTRIYASPAGWNAGALSVTPNSCDADLTGDGKLDVQDFLLFLNAWAARDPLADWNADGVVDTRDFTAYLNEWVAGC